MYLSRRKFILALPATALAAAAPAAVLAQGAPLQLGKPHASPAQRAINRAATPPRISSQDAAESVRKANGYFNSVKTMIADFTQVGADGRTTTGKLYLQKPGRMRFEYDRPSPLEIIADGTSVAIRNRRLAKQDLYFIRQTPLKFLLSGHIDLAKDTKVLDVSNAGPMTVIAIEDRATFGGTSRIRLMFDPKSFALKQWVVFDPQGYETRVALSNVDLRAVPDSDLFKINYERTD